METGPDFEVAVRLSIDELIKTKNSPGYKLLMQQLEHERQQAFEALSSVNPFDSREIMRLQSIVARHDFFVERIDELIVSGVQQEALSDEEHEFID